MAIRSQVRATLSPLTPRELDVLRLAARGWSVTEIVARLDLAESTVKNHLYASRRRIAAASNAHAVAIMDDHFPGWRDSTGFVPPTTGLLIALLREAADVLEADAPG